jgi:hypothetical protein
LNGLIIQKLLALGNHMNPPPPPPNNGDGGLKDDLALWTRLEAISKSQGQIWLNWHLWFDKFVVAPATNYQEILSRWVIGKQVNIYKTSDAGLENVITSNVAGYGSQLGTILDYLEQVQNKLVLPERQQNDKDPVYKLNKLIDDIKDKKRLRKEGKL